jgi:hypothetical protein
MRYRLAAAAAALLLAAGLVSTPAVAAPAGGPAHHTITFDKYSLMIDGRRIFIWSGEFHYWRLPSPDLWRDVLQKMKADGYDAVSIYFDWGYHSPAPGVYDFTGVRDIDQLLDIAAEVGIYVIARPGPYINAETTGGGFPGWLTTQAGRAPSDAPDYLAAADEWLHHVDAIIKRHQLTDGTGTVILYQIENELASTGTSQRNYMQNLYDTVRSGGITVPIFDNDKGRNGIWVPAGRHGPGHGARTCRHVRLRQLPGRHLPPTGQSAGRAPRRTTACSDRVVPLAEPAPRRTRRDSRQNSAAAGSTIGAAWGRTSACRSARDLATSASSMTRTSPTGCLCRTST